MKRMKKILLSALALFIVITISACSGAGGKDISPSQLNEKISAKETFVLVASQSTCGACKAYEPTVEEFIQKDKDIKLYDVVIDKVSDAQEKNDFLTKYNITGTPTTLFFKDGELKTMVEGVISLDKLESLSNQYVK